MAPSASRSPRVLFATTRLLAGGSETQLVRLLSATHRDRLTATLMTVLPGIDPRLVDEVAALGIPRIDLGLSQRSPLSPLRGYAGAIRELRSSRPDAVYAWLEPAAALLVPPARRMGIPTLVARRSLRGANAESNPLVRRVIRAAERSADLVTVNSRAGQEQAVRRGIERDRIRVVPNGHPITPPLAPAPQPPVSIGYLANYWPHKGHLRMIAALQRLRATTPWRVEMRGVGPIRDSIEAEVSRRGLADRVEVGPRLSGDPAGFWARQHIAALASDSEGSPNALIEAALAGRPAVATDAPGVAETIGPGGIVVERDDPEALAAALRRLIDGQDLRARLGQAAHDEAAARFDIERSVEGHLAALDEAIALRRERPGQ